MNDSGLAAGDRLRPVLARWREDADGTYRTWFLWEERLKNFRSIRRGLAQVIHEIEAGRARWRQRYEAAPRRDADFTTLSGDPVEPVYGPPPGDDVSGFERIGWPGEYPYTRGLYPTGDRGRAWTIREFAGICSADGSVSTQKSTEMRSTASTATPAQIQATGGPACVRFIVVSVLS